MSKNPFFGPPMGPQSPFSVNQSHFGSRQVAASSTVMFLNLIAFNYLCISILFCLELFSEIVPLSVCL